MLIGDTIAQTVSPMNLYGLSHRDALEAVQNMSLGFVSDNRFPNLNK